MNNLIDTDTITELQRTARAQKGFLLESQIPNGQFDAAVRAGVITGERDRFPWVLYTPESDFSDEEVAYLPWLACQPTSPPDQRTPTPPIIASLFALDIHDIGVLHHSNEILMLEADRHKAAVHERLSITFTDAIHDDQWEWIEGMPVETPKYALRAMAAGIGDLSWMARAFTEAHDLGISMEDLYWTAEPTLETFDEFRNPEQLVSYCFEIDNRR